MIKIQNPSVHSKDWLYYLEILFIYRFFSYDISNTKIQKTKPQKNCTHYYFVTFYSIIAIANIIRLLVQNVFFGRHVHGRRFSFVSYSNYVHFAFLNILVIRTLFWFISVHFFHIHSFSLVGCCYFVFVQCEYSRNS